MNIYRAATQSITTDEAFTYLRSVSVPIPTLWESFDANDHVLHTLLCKVTVAIFGLSELTLRLPSLLGGLLLLGMYLRLSRMLFGGGLYFFAVFLLQALNPLLLDYSSIARGYGLATALLLVALAALAQYRDSARPVRILYVAAVSLGLAVASNLTVIVPGTALVIAFAAANLRTRRHVNQFLDHMVVPGILVAAGLLVVPLLHAGREDFYLGADTVAGSIESVVNGVLWRERNPWMALPNSFRIWEAIRLTAFVAVPLLAALAIIQFARQRRRPALEWLLAGTFFGSIVLILAMHAALGTPYPYRRTALYFLPLFTMLAGIVLRQFPKPVAAVPALLVLAQFVLCWNVRYYDEWLFDAGSRDIAQRIPRLAPGNGHPPNVHVEFPMGQSIEFYRRLNGLDFQVIPEGAGDTPPADVYVLLPFTPRTGLREVFRHPVSGSVIALPASHSRP